MRAVSLVFLLLCTCGPGVSHEHTRRHVDGIGTAPCLAWANRTITYHAYAPTAAEGSAVDAAFGSWQSAADTCSDLRFVAGTGTSTENVVVWRTQHCADVVPAGDPCLTAGTCGFDHSCWDFEAETLALTTVTYSISTGVLRDADIQLNAADWLFTTLDSPPCPKGSPAATCVATDVQNTVTHEIGHLLGFDHVSNRNSTMSATAALGDLAKRVIDPGTVEGLCTVYPRGAPSPSCPASP